MKQEQLQVGYLGNCGRLWELFGLVNLFAEVVAGICSRQSAGPEQDSAGRTLGPEPPALAGAAEAVSVSSVACFCRTDG